MTGVLVDEKISQSGVFASGSGSNFQVIEEAARAGELDAEIVASCDR